MEHRKYFQEKKPLRPYRKNLSFSWEQQEMHFWKVLSSFYFLDAG